MKIPKQTGACHVTYDVYTLENPLGKQYRVSYPVGEIWRLCNGKRTVNDLKQKITDLSEFNSNLPRDICSSLDEILTSLEARRLIEYYPAPHQA